jgi:hypothetical protein
MHACINTQRELQLLNQYCPSCCQEPFLPLLPLAAGEGIFSCCSMSDLLLLPLLLL